MRQIMRFAALACVSFGAVAMAAPVHLQAPIEQVAHSPVPVRRRRVKLAPSSSGLRRGRGLQAKPKRHRNMMHVSRRTRRKHRRAA